MIFSQKVLVVVDQSKGFSQGMHSELPLELCGESFQKFIRPDFLTLEITPKPSWLCFLESKSPNVIEIRPDSLLIQNCYAFL